MRAQWLRFELAITLALVMLSANPGFAQSSQPDTSSGAVLYEPFSAVSYVREVKILPNGKQQFIQNVRYPTRLARDAAGRIRIDIVTDPPEECDQMQMLSPPACPDWPVVIFDPHAQTSTHWEGGEFGYHGPVVVNLTTSQLQDAETATLTMPSQPTAETLDDPNATFQSLGERQIDGIDTTGIRITRVFWLDQGGARVRTVHIHEVWVSEPMQLVVRIIDGDPTGEETVAGLDHVSLGDHPDLFQLPSGYRVYHYDQGRFIGDDISLLASWFVRLPDESDSQ